MAKWTKNRFIHIHEGTSMTPLSPKAWRFRCWLELAATIMVMESLSWKTWIVRVSSVLVVLSRL